MTKIELKQWLGGWEKYIKHLLSMLGRVISNSDVSLFWVQSKPLCFLKLFSQYFSRVGSYRNGDVILEIATQKFPRKAARLLLISWFPSPVSTFCSWQVPATNPDREESSWASVGPTGSGWDGGWRRTSLYIFAAGAWKELAAILTDWHLLNIRGRGGEFLWRSSFQPFITSSFYFLSDICIHVAVPFTSKCTSLRRP